MTQSGHGGGPAGRDDRDNSRSQDVILFLVPDVVLGRGEVLRRREFIALAGSTAIAWPLAAHAQQPAQMRRIGVLESAGIESDQQAGVAVFKEVLRQSGWIDGRNVRVEVRWAGGDPAKARKDAEELVALSDGRHSGNRGTRVANAAANDTLGADCVQQYCRSAR